MKPKLISLLILFMSLALIGITTVQFLWIQQAFKVKQQQFENAVNKALLNVVNKLDQDEQVIFISTQLENFKHCNDSLQTVFFVKEDSQFQISIPSSVQLLDSMNFNFDIIEGKNIQGLDKLQIDTINYSILQSNQICKGNQEFLVDSAVSEVKIKIENRIKSLEKTMNRYVYEFNPVVKNIIHRVNPTRIKSLLDNELILSGITLSFEFELVSDDSIAPVFQTSDFAKLNTLKPFKVRLFPNDIIQKSDYLIITFPNSKTNILKSMVMLLSASLIFTLFIIIIFAYTILIIIRQKKISEIKNDFINNMTHEFKTPIATISLASDAIGNPRVISDQNEIIRYLAIIKEENNRMNNHVEKILQTALVDKMELNLKLGVFNVHELIENSVQRFSFRIENQKGKINLNFEALNFHCRVDDVHFQNVMGNLIDNALKYTQNAPEITITTINQKNSLVIHVKDNGIGISKETQNQIFEKFYRVPSGNIHNVKGFGLGLSYSKAIIEAFSGQIMVTSEAGKGTNFSISIPYCKIHE